MAEKHTTPEERRRGAYESPTLIEVGSFAELTGFGKKANVPDQFGGANATPPGYS